jgi:DNA-binding HxlR family transcriptional regulator
MLLKDCPVSATLRFISGKWKPIILYELKTGPLSFGQLLRRIPEASHKVLTEQLRQLQAADIITKTISKQSMVRSDYRLSELGQTLRPILNQMASWGAEAKQRQRKASAASTRIKVGRRNSKLRVVGSIPASPTNSMK